MIKFYHRIISIYFSYTHFSILYFFFIIPFSWGIDQPITLKFLVESISKKNYTVLENSLKVYQSKEAIAVARMNLLPRLNFWNLTNNLLTVFAGGDLNMISSTLPLVEDIAPFLVPANWFRLQLNETLYNADVFALKSLWGNELHTAKQLYFHILLDQELHQHIEDAYDEIEKIYKILIERESTNPHPDPTLAPEIKIKLLSLEDDIITLNTLIAEEKASLAYALGLPPQEEISLEPISIEEHSFLVKHGDSLNEMIYYFRTLDAASELHQLDAMLIANTYATKEVKYSFLGVPPIAELIKGLS